MFTTWCGTLWMVFYKPLIFLLKYSLYQDYVVESTLTEIALKLIFNTIWDYLLLPKH